ncbi:MAG: TetR/AcrR family transcriptional regulator [Pseudomonadota bacterium]
MTAKPEKPLREACIEEALAIIEQGGVEALSLRAVARRLGVSHQAPYKHFPSREHILAEIVARTFDEFAAHLDARPAAADPFADLRALGERYLDYARRYPLKYRLMFNAALPPLPEHPEMMRNAERAFAILRTRLGQMALRQAPGGAAPHLDAMVIWSALHGLASIEHADVLATLDMERADMQRAEERMFARLSAAFRPEE